MRACVRALGIAYHERMVGVRVVMICFCNVPF